MKETRDIMGMPVEVHISGATRAALDAVFDYFTAVDERFSTYKHGSEISKINRGELRVHEWSDPMKEIFDLAERTRQETAGYFSIARPGGGTDPSGIVKGWAIRGAARIVESMGYKNYFLNAGGDIQSRGTDGHGKPWTVGIRNPFNADEIIKVLRPEGRGVATSGSYIRGDHIYNPHAPQHAIRDIVSLTVVGPDVYEADRFATAAFAMGKSGIEFIERLEGFEGYLVDAHGTATMTRGFSALTV